MIKMDIQEKIYELQIIRKKFALINFSIYIWLNSSPPIFRLFWNWRRAEVTQCWCSDSKWAVAKNGFAPPHTFSIIWRYKSLASATAVKLLASAVACKCKTRLPRLKCDCLFQLNGTKDRFVNKNHKLQKLQNYTYHKHAFRFRKFISLVKIDVTFEIFQKIFRFHNLTINLLGHQIFRRQYHRYKHFQLLFELGLYLR